MSDETELTEHAWEVWRGEGWAPRKGIVKAELLVIDHGTLIFYRAGKIVEVWASGEWIRVTEAG